MLEKPTRRGVVVGEIYTCRVATRQKLVSIPTEDEDGNRDYKRFWVDEKVESSVVWNGSDWLSSSDFQVWCSTKAAQQELCRKPKTILRKRP
jgi:hypothetical protein